MQKQTTILDSKDGGILMSVDGCTLNAVLEACVAKPNSRLEELISAIRDYQEYKRAQKLVAAYEQPERIEAIKATFAGRRAKS